MSSLRFAGELSPMPALGLALLLGALAFWLYRRDTGARNHPLGRWLVTLRLLVIALVLLLLCGPVLRRVEMIGEVGKVFLLVDTSRSMELRDPAMEPHRKAQLLDQLARGAKAEQVGSGEALRELTRARAAIGWRAAALSPEETALSLERVAEHAAAAAGKLDKAAAARLQGEIVEPARRAAAESRRASPQENAAALASLREAAARWEAELETLADAEARQRAGTPGNAPQANAAFDETTRWQRFEALMTAGSFLWRLAESHEVELLGAGGPGLERVWAGDPVSLADGAEPPSTLAARPTNAPTDLGTAFQTLLAGGAVPDRSAVVLFSDGRHNDGTPPATAARILGNRAIPVFTVGYGAVEGPRDLALLSVTAPESVFIDDRARGELVLHDDLEPGRSFLARIEAGGKTVWAETLKSEGKSPRRVPFEFAVRDLIPPQPAGAGELTNSATALSLRAVLESAGAEVETNNNAARFHFLAVSQRPKVLLLDGRPRWEFRYLRNLFERDQQWEVNALLAGAGGGEQRPWPRGTGAGKFPADRETLFAHHLVVFGDLPPGYLGTNELTWLREFVEKRGGGILFVDGRQEQLANYSDGPLAPLLPVGWNGAPIEDDAVLVELTTDGAASPMLALADDPAGNARLWGDLPAPKWIAPSVALPGSDVLLMARLGERAVPLLAFRRFGAGRVLYAAHEDSWRWRYEVADQHHRRFWNQAFRRIMDAPYAVSDKRLSLDAGAAAYAPRDKAEIRMQVRDEQGRLTSGADAEVELFRDGEKVATLPVREQDEGSGVYRATTGELAPGGYEVRPRVTGLGDSDLRARVRFTVEPRTEVELADLTMNEPLLRELAAQSGGRHFREEHAALLLDALAPLSRGRLEERETVLWQSPWVFALVVLLLTAEWILRKRAGLL